MEITGVRTHITVGSFDVVRAPRVRLDYTDRPLSRARVILADPDGDIYQGVSIGEKVVIRLGYLDEEPSEWEGIVSWRSAGSTNDQVEIRAVGVEAPLSGTLITQAWENETPEAIVRWAVNQTGLSVGRIDSPGVTLPRFVASNIPVWQVARQCEHTLTRAFGLDMRGWGLWIGADGVNWGDFNEDGDIPVIGTAEGLISHRPSEAAAGLNEATTYLLSGFRNRRVFKLRDRRRGIEETFRALQVRHEVTGHSARTRIWYGEAYERN